MGATQTIFGLPLSLLALLSVATADQVAPRAIKKLSPDLGEKLLAQDIEFALPLISAYDASSFQLDTLTEESSEQGSSLYRRAFSPHYYESDDNVLRRAAEALAILERRAACPGGMSSCADIGAPNKCCQQGTYCTSVDDSTVGGVACCPQGNACGGTVGDCPGDAVSCPASLGGGCCIAGYVCQGAGCVPSASATPTTATEVKTTTEETPPDTITTTRTTIIEGEPSTVVVTMTVTRKSSVEPTTTTSTEIVTVSEPESSTSSESRPSSRTTTGSAPWRPTSGQETSEATEPTQTGCPTGFYGCLATHGGGCCQTGRDCETTSCPAQPSTTIVSNGATIVVAVSDVPSQATSTCADGWFLCGEAAGPVAGCCPNGYQCGTASCFSAQASETAQVQKEFPDTGASNRLPVPLMAVVAAFFALAML